MDPHFKPSVVPFPTVAALLSIDLASTYRNALGSVQKVLLREEKCNVEGSLGISDVSLQPKGVYDRREFGDALQAKIKPKVKLLKL